MLQNIVDTVLGGGIGGYCLNEAAKRMLIASMQINETMLNRRVDTFGNGVITEQNKVSDEYTEYDYSYAKGMNYIDNFQKKVNNTEGKDTTVILDSKGNGYKEHRNLYYLEGGVVPPNYIEPFKNSLLDKTTRLFIDRKNNNIISRFHTDTKGNMSNPVSETAVTEKYGQSHGRNLLTFQAETGENKYKVNGYDDPYCRVWTHHHQYIKHRHRLMRPFSVIDEKENVNTKSVQDVHKWETFKQDFKGDFGWKDSDNDDRKYSVLNNRNGFLNIAPKYDARQDRKIHPKDCMFSIENLAWQGYDPYSFEKALSWEQRGPFGGRIMWFPPYGLRFHEDTQTNWSEHNFIGRGESVYTYTNTRRSGNLSFMMVVDHPSILDYATWHNPQGLKDTDIHRFFAGCDPLSYSYTKNTKKGSNNEHFSRHNYVVESSRSTTPDDRHNSLLSFVRPMPINEDEFREDERPKKPIPVEEPEEEKNVEPMPPEPIVLNFFAFYPNNYSGYYDRQKGSVVDPIAYLLFGDGAQWECNTTDVTRSTPIPITFDIEKTIENTINKVKNEYKNIIKSVDEELKKINVSYDDLKKDYYDIKNGYNRILDKVDEQLSDIKNRWFDYQTTYGGSQEKYEYYLDGLKVYKLDVVKYASYDEEGIRNDLFNKIAYQYNIKYDDLLDGNYDKIYDSLFENIDKSELNYLLNIYGLEINNLMSGNDEEIIAKVIEQADKTNINSLLDIYDLTYEDYIISNDDELKKRILEYSDRTALNKILSQYYNVVESVIDLDYSNEEIIKNFRNVLFEYYKSGGGRGYEMLGSGSTPSTQDSNKNYIVGTAPNWRLMSQDRIKGNYRPGKMIGGTFKDSVISTGDNCKKWYYRIDGKYENAQGEEQFRNTFDQTLANDKGYQDERSYNLNCDVNVFCSFFGIKDKDKDTTFSLAELALALTNKETLVFNTIKNNMGGNSYNETRINYLREKLNNYQVEKIECIGYSNSQGKISPIVKERNDFLAKERAETFADWFRKNCQIVDDSFNIKATSESSKEVAASDEANESAITAKMWRSAKLTVTLNTSNTEDVEDTNPEQEQSSQGGENEAQDIAMYAAETSSGGENPSFKVKRSKLNYKGKNATIWGKKYKLYEHEDNHSKLYYKLNGQYIEYNGDPRDSLIKETDTQIKQMMDDNQKKLSIEARKELKIIDVFLSRMVNGQSTPKNNKYRYDQEYYFFKQLQEKNPLVFEKLTEKLQYFDPAFHSMTPEGFMGRLTFLQQCTRQGDTVGASDNKEGHAWSANNLAFGRPPVCVLRLGDFYYQKIIINNISIDYDPLQLDLNPEGAGVVPLIANVNISFNFIGGGDLTGPVRKLQNAMSFNYYANTRLYDNRADRVERKDNEDYRFMGSAGHNDVNFGKSYFHEVPFYKK